MSFKPNVFSITLIISALLHVALMTIAFKKETSLSSTPEKQKFDVKTISQEELAEMKKAMLDKQQSTPAMPKQIVETELDGAEVKPNNSRFLSEKNQSFDRQTIAKKVDTFKEAGAGKTTKVAGAKKVAPAKDVIGTKTTNKKISLSDLSVGEELDIADSGTLHGKAGVKGVAQSNDYVEDVPLGEQTHLNTTEFKYYGFYHRIKQKLEQHWGASLQEKMERIYKSGRQIASVDNRITSLVVKLDEKGNIVEVQISSTSGVRELDDAAIESFNKAGPFPNPPKGMMENGVARIEWGFVVKG
jgi:protein TonB